MFKKNLFFTIFLAVLVVKIINNIPVLFIKYKRKKFLSNFDIFLTNIKENLKIKVIFAVLLNLHQNRLKIINPYKKTTVIGMLPQEFLFSYTLLNK